MNSRNRPGRDARNALKEGLNLAEAVTRGDTERARQLAAQIQLRERERIARASLARVVGQR